MEVKHVLCRLQHRLSVGVMPFWVTYLLLLDLLNEIWSSVPFTKKRAYKALTGPSVEFVCYVWDPALHKKLKKDITQVESVQRHAVRVSLGRCKNASRIGEMLISLSCPCLQSRRKYSPLFMMYEIAHKLAHIHNRFLKTPNRNTRHPHCNIPNPSLQNRLQEMFLLPPVHWWLECPSWARGHVLHPAWRPSRSYPNWLRNSSLRCTNLSNLTAIFDKIQTHDKLKRTLV